MNPSSVLLQLTDLHICSPGRLANDRVDTAGMLQQCVRALLRLPQQPDAIVITGDLTEHGRAEEYEHLRTLLAPLNHLPMHLLPGNHDDRRQLRASFADHTYLAPTRFEPEADGFIQYSVPIAGKERHLQLLTLDTVVPQQGTGALCRDRLDWLADALERHREDAVVVAMHHPPFKTLIAHMDDMGLLEGAAELDALLRRYTNVERVISGHLHRAIEVRFGGTVASTIPSPAHQIAMDLGPSGIPGWTLEPPGFALHVLPPQGPMITHHLCSAEFGGPYAFSDS